MLRAEGEAKGIRATGEAEGAKILAIGESTAKAYDLQNKKDRGKQCQGHS